MKELIKKIVGPFGIMMVKKLKMLKNIIVIAIKGTKGKCEIMGDSVIVAHLTINDKNVFFGYYDLQQMDKSQQRLLVHVCDVDADTSKNAVELRYYDLSDHQYHSLCKSRAWSWQQGSRLRWSPIDENNILFNDMEDGQYVTKVFDVEKRKTSKIVPIPLYDIDRKQQYGLGINFSRLQRLRPGYGYNSLPDETDGINIPKNDGIFKYNFESGKIELLISYDRLCETVKNADRFQHYINHICISPDGSKFMFFHIWTEGPGMKWTVRLCVASNEGNDINILEEERIISHYTWKNNKTLLTTYINKDCNRTCYAEYDVLTGERTEIGDFNTHMDGHPTYMLGDKEFITDTYPLTGNMQYLYIYDTEIKQRRTVLEVFHNPRLYDEKRCDLHPRITADNKYVSVDCAYDGKKKSVLIIKMNK